MKRKLVSILFILMLLVGSAVLISCEELLYMTDNSGGRGGGSSPKYYPIYVTNTRSVSCNVQFDGPTSKTVTVPAYSTTRNVGKYKKGSYSYRFQCDDSLASNWANFSHPIGSSDSLITILDL